MRTNSLEVLEKSRLPPEQARAILRAMELEIGEREERLVTKGDLHALELRMGGLELKMEQFKGEVRADMKALETRLVLWMFGMFVALAGLLYAFPRHG